MSEQDLLQNPFGLESFCVTPAKTYAWMWHREYVACVSMCEEYFHTRKACRAQVSYVVQELYGAKR